MGEEQALGSRLLVRGDRLVQREMTAGLPVELAAQERRLADEEVGVTGRGDELRAGRRVAEYASTLVEFSTRKAYVWSV